MLARQDVRWIDVSRSLILAVTSELSDKQLRTVIHGSELDRRR